MSKKKVGAKKKAVSNKKVESNKQLFISLGRPTIYGAVLIVLLFLMVLNFFSGNLTAKVIGSDLCGNDVVNENETCSSCPEDVSEEEVCDYKDNDCDDKVDEGIVCATSLRCGSYYNNCGNESCHYGVCGKPILLLDFDDVKKQKISYNGFNGTLMKRAKLINTSLCLFNGCLSLLKDNDYLNLTQKPVNAILADNFTVSFWAKSDSAPDKPTFGFAASDAKVNNPLVAYDVAISVAGGPGYQDYQLFNYFYPNAQQNEWRHYALVDNGTKYVAYVDGKKDFWVDIKKNPGSPDERQLIIGESGFDGNAADNFDGYFDEFFIYDRALSDEEIKAIYDSGQE